MKKVVGLTESDLLSIVKKVLTEQVIQGKGSDPYEYKKEGGKYYTRKKGSTSWILTKDTAASAIATKIFKDTLPQTTVNKPSQKITPVSSTTRPDTNIGSDTTTKQGGLVTSITKNIMGELDKTAQLIGNISPRSYAQLNKIIQSKGLASDSFIIVNKDSSIAALFAPNYKFVDKSSITSAFFKDTGTKEDALTYPKWFSISKEYALKNPNTNYGKQFQGYANKIGVKVKDLDYLKHVKGRGGFNYSYGALKELGYARTPSGVYKLSVGSEQPGYSGEGKNTFPLVDIETGQKFRQAIHGAAGKKRESLLKKAGSEDVSKTKEYTRAGTGCVNVDANFISQMQKYNPQYVVILPDSGGSVEIPKIVPIKTWTDKVVEMGSNCVKSFFDLFS